MFNIEFLHVIREYEYKNIVARFVPGARILEIGGGTGYQAKRLSEDGFRVDSIDVPSSNYVGHQDFPVKTYDGRTIPFSDREYDIVFSSNVLEHVLELSDLQVEIKRVLKPDGYCVHLMPSGAWRFWTNVAHYVELFQRLYGLAPRLLPNGLSKHALSDSMSVLRLMGTTAKHYVFVPRHGEVGNAFSEIYTFSAVYWRKHFLSERFSIHEVTGVGIFYTGHMVFGSRLSLAFRQKLSKFFGSACLIYVVRPD